MNITDEQLIMLVAVLGEQNNYTTNEAIDGLDDEFYYTLGDKYSKPEAEGWCNQLYVFYQDLIDEGNKRGLVKYADDEWIK